MNPGTFTMTVWALALVVPVVDLVWVRFLQPARTRRREQ